MNTLRHLAWMNSMGRVNSLGRRGIGSTNFPSTRAGGSGVAGGTTGGGDTIEIHLVQGGGNGANVVGNSGRINPQPFNSRTTVGGSIDGGDIRERLAGSAGVITDGGRRESRGSSVFGNNEGGAPGRADSSVGSSVGSGTYGSRVGGGVNVGIGDSAIGGSLGGITGNVGGIMNGGSVASVSMSNAAAAEGISTGRGSGSSAVVGLLGTTTTSRGNGMRTHGGAGRFDSAGRDVTSSGIIGVGSAVSTRGARGRNSVNAGAAVIGGSFLGGEGSGSSGIVGGSRSFSGDVGSLSEGAVAGSGGRAGGSVFAPENSISGADDEDELGPNLEGNEGSRLGETGLGYANALELRRRFATGLRG